MMKRNPNAVMASLNCENGRKHCVFGHFRSISDFAANMPKCPIGVADEFAAAIDGGNLAAAAIDGGNLAAAAIDGGNLVAATSDGGNSSHWTKYFADSRYDPLHQLWYWLASVADTARLNGIPPPMDPLAVVSDEISQRLPTNPLD